MSSNEYTQDNVFVYILKEIKNQNQSVYQLIDNCIINHRYRLLFLISKYLENYRRDILFKINQKLQEDDSYQYLFESFLREYKELNKMLLLI